MIKPIETVYNGYRFRSRLEARWAVFFDTLGIEYKYEIEGFDLGEAGWYLPDFWFPHPVKDLAHEGWGLWGEIKATELTEADEDKLIALVRYTKHNALALQGSPWEDEYIISKYTLLNRGKQDETVWKSMSCAHFREKDKDIYNKIEIYNPFRWGVSENEISTSYPCVYGASILLDDAYLAARQARFEHGETPSTILGN